MRLPKSQYRAYIQSEAWRQKRRDFFASNLWRTYPAGKRAGKFVCYACGSDERLDIHHRSYARLGNERISNDLICVCRSCHNRIHQLERQEGVQLRQATKLVRLEHENADRANSFKKKHKRKMEKKKRKEEKKLLTSV